MMLAAMGAMAVGTGISAMGQIQAGKAQRAAHEANAEVERMRAKQIDDEAREIAGRMRTNHRSQLASMRAKMAAGGTTLTGSNMNVLSESAQRLELKVQDHTRAAAIDASNKRFQSRLNQWEGQIAEKSSTVKATGSLLSGLGSIGFKGASIGAFG